MAVSKLREGDYCPDGSGAFDRAVGEEETGRLTVYLAWQGESLSATVYI